MSVRPPNRVWRSTFHHKYAFIDAMILISQCLGWSRRSAYDHQRGNRHIDFSLLRIDNCSGFVPITFRRTSCSITL